MNPQDVFNNALSVVIVAAAALIVAVLIYGVIGVIRLIVKPDQNERKTNTIMSSEGDRS